MSTTAFVEDSGVRVDLPAARTEGGSHESLVLVLNARGEVFHDGRVIGVGGVRGLVEKAVETEPQTAVILQVDPAAHSGMVVGLIDEVKMAGATKVGVSTSGNPDTD